MSLQIAGAILSVIGQSRAASAEARRQEAIAIQQEQNKKFEQLRALQEHNARVGAFIAYQSTTNAVRAINRRGPNDRSIKALMKAGKTKSQEDLARSATQSLFTQSRMQFAADDARSAGATALQTGFFKTASSLAMMGYQMQQVTPTGD